MIFNRTQEDVDKAKQIREEKVKKFSTLSENEKTTLERGFFTVNTLNRIEQKQHELYAKLLEYGYDTGCTNKTDWTSDDIVKENVYTRLLNNLNNLKKGFTYLKNGTETPKSMLDFEKLNDVEKILYDIENLLNNMVNSWIYVCDEYFCGGVI